MEDGDQVDVHLEQQGGGGAADDEGAGAEVKPDVAQVSLQIVSQDGNAITLKVKKNTKFGKIMAKYATHQGLDLTALKFMFDGQRISEDDTPAGLEMEDDDKIDVAMQQVGGGTEDDEGAGEGKPDLKPDVESITISLQSQDGTQTQFKVKKTMRFEKIMKKYAQHMGLDGNSLRFMFEGSLITPETTPEQLELEEGDQIDVMIAQLGGRSIGLLMA